MTTEDDFIAAILARPGDDTQRLVYADWLQERGQDERAGFIRVQIKVAREPAGRSHRRLRVKGAHRAHTFETIAFAKPWEVSPGGRFLDPLVVLCGQCGSSYATSVAWHRGLPAVVGCTERQWHLYHRHFAGPVPLVCLNRVGAFIWRVSGPGVRRRYASRVSQTAPRVEADCPAEARAAAFPGVGRFHVGRCTDAILAWHCVHGFEG